MWSKKSIKRQRANRNNDVLEETHSIEIKILGITVSKYYGDYACDRPDGKVVGLKSNNHED